MDTEGETFYKGRKAYGTMAVCIPVGMGVKYAVTDKVNMSFEIAYRFTTTDYIDDVSTTYVGIDKFPARFCCSPIAGPLICAWNSYRYRRQTTRIQQAK